MAASSGGHCDDMHKIPKLNKSAPNTPPSSTNSSTNYRIISKGEGANTTTNTPYWNK